MRFICIFFLAYALVYQDIYYSGCCRIVQYLLHCYL